MSLISTVYYAHTGGTEQGSLEGYGEIWTVPAGERRVQGGSKSGGWVDSRAMDRTMGKSALCREGRQYNLSMYIIFYPHPRVLHMNSPRMFLLMQTGD